MKYKKQKKNKPIHIKCINNYQKYVCDWKKKGGEGAIYPIVRDRGGATQNDSI